MCPGGHVCRGSVHPAGLTVEHLPRRGAAARSHSSLHCSRWPFHFFVTSYCFHRAAADCCLFVLQAVWLPSSTQTLLRLPLCWLALWPSWASVSPLFTSSVLHPPVCLTLLVPGFVEVGGWNALIEGYANAIPAIRVPNSTCGIPRSDAFHIFRHPVTSDLPWPGVIIGMSIPSMWYWCSDQVLQCNVQTRGRT